MIKFTNRYFSSPPQRRFLMEKLQEALESDAFIGGEAVEALEREMAAYYGVKACVSCGNGTDALELALSYFSDAGGEVVFCPSYTYIATAEAIVRSGAIPWFVDIDPETLTICPDNLCENIAAAQKQGHKVAGVISVDMFGNPCKYHQLREICRREGLFLIADSAQSFGAKYAGGGWGDYVDACTFSFYPTKPLGGIGDGGAIITNNDEMQSFLRAVSRHQARANKHGVEICGRNSRLDSMNAQVLSAKLAVLDAEISGRGALVARLAQALSERVRLQKVEGSFLSSWCNLTLLFENEADLKLAEGRMKESAIETRRYYLKLTHIYSEFAAYPSDGKALVHSKEASQHGLSIPAHGCLGEEDIARYFEALHPFLKQ